jgi:hypothetical protein
MKNFFKATSIPLTIAFLSAIFVFYFSYRGNGIPTDNSATLGVFGFFITLSYFTYLILLGIFLLIIWYFKLPRKYIYIGNFVAFFVGYFIFPGSALIMILAMLNVPINILPGMI